MHPILNIAVMAARKAGDVMLRALNRLDTIHPTAKGRHDFVTDVDKQAEKEILYILRKHYPNHAILTEETGFHPSKGVDISEGMWIIDPLDGTHNYLRGVPHFCVSIAFQEKNKIEHGVVYDPIRQELFTASRGRGAQLNQQRLRVSKTGSLDQALISTGFPLRYPEQIDSYLMSFQKLLPQIANIRCMGSAALDLCYVAAGRLDGYIQRSLHLWDIAAGILITQEAGGLVKDWVIGEENSGGEGIKLSKSPARGEGVGELGQGTREYTGIREDSGAERTKRFPAVPATGAFRKKSIVAATPKIFPPLEQILLMLL